MHLLLKEGHMWLRWLVLALAVVVVIVYVAGYFARGRHAGWLDKLSLAYVSGMDLQLVIGLLLWFFYSPYSRVLLTGGNVVADSTLRFYAIEHPLTMILAVVFVHLGRTGVRKAATDQKKYQRGLIYYAVALLFMLSRMPW